MADSRILMDSLGMMQQLGVVPNTRRLEPAKFRSFPEILVRLTAS